MRLFLKMTAHFLLVDQHSVSIRPVEIEIFTPQFSVFLRRDEDGKKRLAYAMAQ